MNIVLVTSALSWTFKRLAWSRYCCAENDSMMRNYCRLIHIQAVFLRCCRRVWESLIFHAGVLHWLFIKMTHWHTFESVRSQQQGLFRGDRRGPRLPTPQRCRVCDITARALKRCYLWTWLLEDLCGAADTGPSLLACSQLKSTDYICGPLTFSRCFHLSHWSSQITRDFGHSHSNDNR